MSKTGRPSKPPILPQKADTSKDRVYIGGKVVYPKEKELLEEKIKEEGYTSLSEWIREEAKKVLTDQDLRERREKLEKRIEERESKNQKDRKKLKQIEEQLKGREKELEDKLGEFREELIRYNKHKNTVNGASKFAYQITGKIPIKWVDIDQVINILEHWVNESKLQDIESETFADNIIEELREENLVRVREGSD